MTNDSLGDRMKVYERAEAGRRFMPLLPVYARIDGRNFTRFTRGMERPFDRRMVDAMIETTRHLVDTTLPRIAYTQSDEISLIWLTERYDAEIFFDGRIQKMCSVLAAMTTARFMQEAVRLLPGYEARLPCFDCRVFQLPNRTEGANAFLWREIDATKNAVSMAARAFYGAKDLQGKSSAELQEMLFRKGVNFNDYPAFFKRGTFVRRSTVERAFTPQELARIPEQHRPKPGTTVSRMQTIALDMPIFSKVTNREAVIFDGADPVTAA